MITGGIIEVGSFGTLTVGFVFAESAGIGLIGHGLSMTTDHAKDISWPGSFHVSNTEKRHTPDQEAMSELVKEYGKKGVSNTDADTLLDWAKEYDFPNRDDRGKLNEQGKPHWEGGEHIHLGPKHVKVNN